MKEKNKTSLDTAKRGKERPPGKTAGDAIKEAGQLIAKLTPEEEKKECNIKVVAVVVKADGNLRLKVKREKMPELAPAEKLIFKLTYERDGVPLGSVLREIKRFADALMQSLNFRL